MNDTTRPVLAASTALSTRRPAASPDAKLLGWIKRFNDLEDEANSHYGQGLTVEQERERDEKIIKPIWKKQEALKRRILTTAAATLDGLLARIEMLEKWAPCSFSVDAGGSGGMIGAIIRDAAEMRRARESEAAFMSTLSSHHTGNILDAALIAACAEHVKAHSAVRGAPDDGPADDAYIASLDKITGVVPQTFGGIIALVRSIMVEAYIYDGTLTVEGGIAEEWCFQAVQGLHEGLEVARPSLVTARPAPMTERSAPAAGTKAAGSPTPSNRGAAEARVVAAYCAMDDARQSRFVQMLTEIACDAQKGRPMRDAMVRFHLDLGCSQAEAESKVDEVLVTAAGLGSAGVGST